MIYKPYKNISSSPFIEHAQSNGKHLLNNEVTFMESGIININSELQCNTDLELTFSSSDTTYLYEHSSDATYLYEHSSNCDSSAGNSSEEVFVPSDNTFIYNISSSDLDISTENPNLGLSSENSFDTNSLEISLPNRNVTDTDSSNFSEENQDSDRTYLYDSSVDNSRSSNSFKEVYFNQNVNNSEKISIYYTNCDSVLNKREELTLEIDNFDPDIIVLTEIFPKSIVSTEILKQELKIEGYDLLLGKVTEKSRGVCIYVKTGLSYYECKILTETSYNESCWCIIRLDFHKEMLIGGIYRSPNSKEDNSRHLIELINMAVGLKLDYTVIIGDFNYPNISWADWTTPNNHTHPEFKFIECLRDNFLNQLISEPTRYRDGQRPNILDLLIVDKSEIVSKVTYSSNLGASDHICFIAEIHCNLAVQDTDTVKRNFYKGNYEDIRQELSAVNWENMDNLNVEESWNFFIDKIKNSIDKHVPLKKVKSEHKKEAKMDKCRVLIKH